MKRFLPLLLCLSVIPLFSQGDIIAIMNLEGTLLEVTEERNKPVKGATVRIPMHTEKVTDALGSFSFKVPIRKRDKGVHIQVIYPNYEILDPLNGVVSLDSTSFKVEVEVLVAGPEMADHLRGKLDRLKKRVKKLESEEGMARNRLNRLHRTMVDTILFFQRQQRDYENTIDRLNDRLEMAEFENQALRDSLNATRQQLKRMQDSVEVITAKLYDALEARYLRQQQFFEKISSGLYDYLLRLKDVAALLPDLKEYFSPETGYDRNYNGTWKAYERAYINIFNNRENHLEAVERYWETAAPFQELQGIYQFIIEKTHNQNVFPANRTINSFIRNRQVGRARKTAEEAHEALSPLTKELERKIETVVRDLRENF